jgi:hypothetical protein
LLPKPEAVDVRSILFRRALLEEPDDELVVGREEFLEGGPH